MRQMLFILLLLAAAATKSTAQKSLLVEAGTGMSFVTLKHGGEDYAPRFTPHFLLSAHLPLSHVFALETGIGYTEKGFKAHSVFVNDDGIYNTTDVYDVKLHYYYLDVPLMLSCKVLQRKSGQLWIGAGMNYGFLLKAKQVVVDNTYREGEYLSTSSYSRYQSIGLVSSQTDAKTGYKELYMFNPAVKLGIRYYWRSRYLIGLHYDMNLYDMTTSNTNSYFLRLQYVAMSVGYRF
ncbi:outer membrane beta-barrel protein [Chitinophagaceae bacterium MMS25-I14]